MYKTKLCILFKKSGNCSRPNCTFAHGTAELRQPGESSFPVESAGFSCAELYIGFLIDLESTFFMNKTYHGFCGGLILPQPWFSDSKILVASQCLLLGLIVACCYDFWHFHVASYVYGAYGRHHHMDNDLRDRLGRQFSPERRPSLDRSGRRLQRYSGHENPRPFESRRGRDYRENRRFDEQDYPGDLKVGHRIEDRAEDGRNKFLGYNNGLEEQLKDVEMDVKMLTDDKLRLEASVERKAQEAGILTSRIQDLETQLDREKEECRRITSITKKFVKEYNHFMRAQDDLKRSEARLQKLASQFSTYLVRTESNDRDADTNIVSGEENNGRNLRTASDPNELHNTSSMSRKKPYVDQYTTKEPVEDERSEEEKVGKVNKRPSRWNMDPSKSYSEEESGAWNDEETINKSSSKEDNWKRRRLSFGTSSINKVTSSTSMAAQAFDDGAEFDEENPEEAKSSPLISLPPPPPPFRDVQLQGDEEDANVDVMEQSKASDVDSPPSDRNLDT